jgi:Rrf2 family iron-sulfur cluster assembly transcriptional regulator
LPIKTVIEAIEGGKLFSGCGFGLKHCDANNPCPLHHHFAPIRDSLNTLVVSETIQTLAGNYIKEKNSPFGNNSNSK